MDQRFAVSGVEALTPLAEAAPALLLAKAEPLFALEAAARGGADMDAVHDMRVASRRLRETMRLLQPLYPTREFVEWYRRVRRVTRALGPVRDSDVFIDDFSRFAKDLGVGGQRAVAFLIGRRMGVRVRELAVLDRQLARLDLARSERSLRKVARAAGTSPQLKRPLADFAHAAVAERASIVFGALPAALPEANVLQQHALRIDFKRLRYAVEVFAPVYGDDFDDLHDTLTAFQDTLGDLHDLHLFLDMLGEPVLVSEARRAGVSAGDVGQVAELLEARAHQAFAAFVALAAEHPAGELLPELLLPLARRPEQLAVEASEAAAGGSAGGSASSDADIAPTSAAAPAPAVVLKAAAPVTSGEMPQIDPAAQPWRSDTAGLSIDPPVVVGAEPWARTVLVPTPGRVPALDPTPPPAAPDGEEPS